MFNAQMRLSTSTSLQPPMKKPRFPRRPPDAISSVARLTDEAMARIDKLVAYTLSPENQARNQLRAKIGDEAAARVETYLGPDMHGEARAQRYQEVRRGFNSKAFLFTPETRLQKINKAVGFHASMAIADDAGGACDAGGGSETPTSNTGVTQTEESIPTIKLVVGTGRKSKVLELPMRHGHNGSAAFIDWVHITIGKETTDNYADLVPDDHERVLALSYRLESIFGFGVTAKRKSGRDFYRESYMLGRPEENWGYVCIGGQNETILIGITGAGCAAAMEGWELRLHDFLKFEADRPKITRLDLAYDDYMGEKYNPDRAFADFKTGAFQCYKGTEPTVETIGSDWHVPKGKGRTLAVGMRASGKFCRVYEKGMQLGCKDSLWTRVEVEYKSVDRVIEPEMLLEPGVFLAGAYPALNWISETQDRPLTEKKQARITYDRALEVIQTQYGHYINMMVQIEGSADKLFEKIMREGNPRRLQLRDYRTSPEPIRLDRHAGLSSDECNALIGAHMAGEHVPACFFGHAQISDNTTDRQLEGIAS